MNDEMTVFAHVSLYFKLRYDFLYYLTQNKLFETFLSYFCGFVKNTNNGFLIKKI
jgi:hypothetical protein